MSDDVIVAIASAKDCENLVEKFLKLEDGDASFRFADFARVWKESHFELIFCGRRIEEFSWLTNELLVIAKSILLNASESLVSRVGGLYLMYGLYFIQQSKSKIYFTISEYKELMKFSNELKEKEIKEAKFIFQKLFIGKAFLFCACTTPNKYIQMNLKRQSDEDLDIVGNAMDDDEYRLVECKGLSNSLNAVEALHYKYEAIKAHLPELLTTTSAGSNKNFPTELRTTLDTLKAEITKIRSNDVHKRGKSVSCPEEVNQGVIRRRIVNSSFQSETRSRRIPVDVRFMASAKK